MTENGQAEVQATQAVPITKKQLEDNVKVSGMWLEAVKRGKYEGTDAVAISMLIGFLDDQHNKAVKALDAESIGHPEWGNKVEKKLCEKCSAAFGEHWLAHPGRDNEWLCKGCFDKDLAMQDQVHKDKHLVGAVQ